MKLHTLLLLIIFVTNVLSETKSQNKVFPIKPGKADSAELDWEGYQCKFSWKVEGGSSEEWEMQMQIEEDEVTCMVGRPGPSSYLIFDTFSASVGGRPLKRVTIEDFSGRQLPHGDQWEVSSNNEVVPTKKFTKQAGLIIMQTAKDKPNDKSKTSSKKAKSKPKEKSDL